MVCSFGLYWAQIRGFSLLGQGRKSPAPDKNFLILSHQQEPNLPYAPKREIFEKLYQDPFGVARILHH